MTPTGLECQAPHGSQEINYGSHDFTVKLLKNCNTTFHQKYKIVSELHLLVVDVHLVAVIFLSRSQS